MSVRWQRLSEYAQQANRARSRVRTAIQLGKMPRASIFPCFDCGKPALEYDHYQGYEDEHALDVQPVCRPCHIARGKTRPSNRLTRREILAAELAAKGPTGPFATEMLGLGVSRRRLRELELEERRANRDDRDRGHFMPTDRRIIEQEPTEPEPLYRIWDIADRLGVESQLIVDWFLEGKIAFCRVGGRGPTRRGSVFRITESQLQRFLQTQAAEHVAEANRRRGPQDKPLWQYSVEARQTARGPRPVKIR